MEFTRRASSGGSTPAGVGLSSAPRRSDSQVTPARVQNRLRQLQALCSPDCQALLFVNGVDGKYNEGARKALNYLLYGCSGHDVAQSGKSDAGLSDALLVVSEQTCFLYLGTSEAYWKFLPILGPVADLQLSAPTEEDEKNLDLVEERKILCFLEATSGFKTVGVELTSGDKMELEKWPLIQVYGIEELGVRGFFTMRHTIVDIGSALSRVYLQLDAHAAQDLITYHVDMLAFHWLTALASLDSSSLHDRSRLSEAALIEPLASFYSYGMLRARANKQVEVDRCKPRASFGIRTNLLDAPSEAKATPANSGAGGQTAVHFTVEACEPMGALRVARTYFLSNGGAGARVLTFDYDGLETAEDNNALERGGRCAYARCLMMAYLAVIRTHKHLVHAFCQRVAVDEKALSALALQHIQDLQLAWFRNYDVAANIEVELCERDLEGNARAATPGSRHAKYLKLALRHIASLDPTPVDLGSVVFGETFLEPPSPAQKALVLTHKIETYCAWLDRGHEEDTDCMSALINRLRFSNRNRHYSMGALLRSEAITGVRMLTGLPEIPTIKGQLWAFQRGLIFSSLRLGSIALDFSKHVAALGCVNADAQARSGKATTVLKFDLKSSLQRYGMLEANPVAMPPPAIVISSGDADRRDFSREVVPQWIEWFKEQGVQVGALAELEECFREEDGLSDKSWGDEPLTVNSMAQQEVQEFVRDVQQLDARQHTSSDPGAISPLDQRPALVQACRVIVFYGEPGCDKRALVQGAMQLAGLTATWKLVAYKNPRSPFTLDPNALAAVILDALPGVSTDGGVVLVVSSCAPAAVVLAAVADNAKLREHVHLDRMVAIINATSMLCPGSVAHEASVAAQCMPGLVSNIVLVNIEALGDGADDTQKRLRCINPIAPVIRAVAGRVTARGDLESLFQPSDTHEGWFEREKVQSMREQLFLASHLSAQALQTPDPWSARRGLLTEAHIVLHPDILFVRTHLVRAIRALFSSPRETLGEWVEQSGRQEEAEKSVMELCHVSAMVQMVQSERAEDVAKSATYVVKAKRGIVTFTKCDNAVDKLQALLCVSGRNLDPEKIVHGFFQGRMPVAELMKERGAADLSKDELAAILQGADKYPLPDGVFFNGSKYVDWSGQTLKEHPCMPEMIDDFLKEERLAVAQHNQGVRVEQQLYQDQVNRCLASAAKAVSQAC